MDEVIDLRPIVEGLLRYWWIIVGVTFVIVLLAAGVNLILPESYDATALVAITEPTQRLQFDERFENIIEESPLLRSYPELATSDELLNDVLAQLPTEYEIETIPDLRGMLTAESGAEPGLLRLIVRNGDPEIAAAIANSWAEVFVGWANELYGNGSTQQAAFFEQQLTEAKGILETAEQQLIEFQARNRLTIFENELNALTDLQESYLQDRQEMTFTLTDVEALRDQLQNSTASSVTLADQLTALTLQTQAFGAETSASLQLQLGSDEVSLTGTSRDDQLDLLNSLATTLQNGIAQIDEALAGLEPQILEKQQAYQEMVTENAQLTRDRDVAQETYLSLARKVDEERILAQDVSGGVRLASRAAPPLNPSGPGLIVSVFVAGIVGVALGMGLALLISWWRRSRSEPQVERERLNARMT